MLRSPRVWLSSLRLARVLHELETYPVPLDLPRIHAQGIDSDRILVIGSGAAVGWGVLSHDLGLGGYLARHISALTGRGVEVTIHSVADSTCDDVLRALRALNLERYEAVILAVGTIEAATMLSMRRWAANLGKVLDFLESPEAASPLVFVMSIPSVSNLAAMRNRFGRSTDHHAQLLDRRTLAVVAGRGTATYLQLPLPPTGTDGHGSPTATQTYGLYSRSMAPIISARLDEILRPAITAKSTSLAPKPPLEAERAMEELDRLRVALSDRYDAVLDLARRVFRTSVAVCIADHERIWLVAKDGVAIEVTERSGTIAGEVIRSGRPLVIEDTHLDPVYSQTRFVTGEPFTRFFAANPIENNDGEVVGAICLVSPGPRQFSELDRILLREMAALLERDIFSRLAGLHGRRPSEPDRRTPSHET